MEFLIIALGATMAIWSAVALMRGSVFLSAAIFLASTSCLPAEFFSFNAAGLTWTFDRFWFLALLVQYAVGWYKGDCRLTSIETTDLAIGSFFIWLTARTVTQPLHATVIGQPDTLMHLINGYAIPFVLFFVLRTSKLDPERLKPALMVLVACGLYLSVTGLLEITKQWSLVFPKFIANPDLGIHFGRARGPMLQSVRLGICLIAFWLPIYVYTVWLRPKSTWNWALLATATPLFWGAAFATLTRSIWMGLGLVILMIVLLCYQGFARRLALFGIMAGCFGILIVKGDDLVAFKREYSAAETRESTYMRAAFAYVSMNMIKDRPLAGFGFNQFQIANKPYLSDRSTNIRVESIRGYVHHNSYLSLMVDLGIVGFALYTFVLLSCIRESIRLWSAQAIPAWARGLSLIALGLTAVHLVQMAFHEVTFSSIENGLLFASFGLVVAARKQFCTMNSPREIARADSWNRTAEPNLPGTTAT